MPSAAAAERSKRKRAVDSEAPKKRRRSASEESEESEDANAKILLMEQGILESKKNYNDITVLLSTVDKFKSGDPESMLAAVALCRIFVRLLAQGSLIFKKTLSEKDAVVVGWLKDQFVRYKSTLVTLLQDEDTASIGLTLCMRVLKAEGEFLYDKEESVFPKAFLEDIVRVVILSDNEDVRNAFIEEYAEQYDDIRYYTFKAAKYVLNSYQLEYLLTDDQ